MRFAFVYYKWGEHFKQVRSLYKSCSNGPKKEQGKPGVFFSLL